MYASAAVVTILFLTPLHLLTGRNGLLPCCRTWVLWDAMHHCVLLTTWCSCCMLIVHLDLLLSLGRIVSTPLSSLLVLIYPYLSHSVPLVLLDLLLWNSTGRCQGLVGWMSLHFSLALMFDLTPSCTGLSVHILVLCASEVDIYYYSTHV